MSTLTDNFIHGTKSSPRLAQRIKNTLATVLVASFSLAPCGTFSQNAEDRGEVVDFSYQSGTHSFDLNDDGISDLLVIGYMSGGTGRTRFDFNFLIERPPHFTNWRQRLYTVVPDNQERNYFATSSNADCILRSLRLVKLGQDQSDWKLVILERTFVPEAGYTESQVEFRLLRLHEASTAGFPIFSYRQIADAVSNGSYCNVDDAFEHEWSEISEQFVDVVEQN